MKHKKILVHPQGPLLTNVLLCTKATSLLGHQIHKRKLWTTRHTLRAQLMLLQEWVALTRLVHARMRNWVPPNLNSPGCCGLGPLRSGFKGTSWLTLWNRPPSIFNSFLYLQAKTKMKNQPASTGNEVFIYVLWQDIPFLLPPLQETFISICWTVASEKKSLEAAVHSHQKQIWDTRKWKGLLDSRKY